MGKYVDGGGGRGEGDVRKRKRGDEEGMGGVSKEEGDKI